MAREPGLSVRLKLTLSYAGFLMVAGFLLIAVVLVFLLRYVPDEAVTVAASGAPGGPGLFIPGRSDLWRAFAPKAALALAFLLRVRAGRRVDPRRPDARPPRRASRRPAGSPGAARSRTGSTCPAAATSSGSSPTRSTRCSPGSRRTSPSSAGSRPTPPTSCGPRWRPPRRSSTSPARTRRTTPPSWSNASTP